MTELFQAHTQWATRPDDERFTSLSELQAFTTHKREISRGKVLPSTSLSAAPVEDEGKYRALAILGPDGAPAAPTNWAFSQMAERIQAPAGYLRKLPSPLVADLINYGLQSRNVEDIGALVRKNGGTELAAVTGPNYGRVWNSEVIDALVNRFGDGVTGDFTVPGEFGRAVRVTKDNTTLFASDRDMFVFLADEKNRIELPNRRNGETGSMARGFFIWNSEVGSRTLGISTFLFDYVCCNRIVWGAEGVQEFRINHTSSAPTRFLEEVAPAIEAYAHQSSVGITDAIAKARETRLEDKVEEFLRGRFGFSKNQYQAIQAVHMLEEERPIETIWDATTAVTAYAKGIKHQDERIVLERAGGRMLSMAK